MRVLAIDAALGACSTALVEPGKCLAIRHGSDSRSATSSLPGLINDMLAEAGGRFEGVAVTVGPGSFTGLRAALALANGLALGAGVKLVGVTVAEALLADCPPPSSRSPWIALDSRRPGRIFLGREDGMEAVDLASLPSPEGPVFVLGDAAEQVVDVLRQGGADAVAAPRRAVSVAAVGQIGLCRLRGELPACPTQPLYVEPPEPRAALATRPAPRPTLQ